MPHDSVTITVRFPEFLHLLIRNTFTASFAALNIMSVHCQQEARVTPPHLAAQWLPVIHIVIGNLKCFLLGELHGVSGHCLHRVHLRICLSFQSSLMATQTASTAVACDR